MQRKSDINDTGLEADNYTEITLLSENENADSKLLPNGYKRVDTEELRDTRKPFIRNKSWKIAYLLAGAVLLIGAGYIVGSSKFSKDLTATGQISELQISRNASESATTIQPAKPSSLRFKATKSKKKLLDFKDIFSPPANLLYSQSFYWFKPSRDLESKWGFSWYFEKNGANDIGLRNTESRWVDNLPVTYVRLVSGFDLSSKGLYDFTNFKVSADLKLVLFEIGKDTSDPLNRLLEKRGRYGSVFNLYLWDVEVQDFVTVGSQKYIEDCQYATFSAAGNVIVVQHGDINLINVEYASSRPVDMLPVTTSGRQNLDVIFNGIPDWVYEEEIFSSENLIFLPEETSGELMAFISLNDTNVPVANVEFTRNSKPSKERLNSYPGHRSIRYPKAGYSNPTVQVQVASQSNSSSAISVYAVKFNEKEIFEPFDLLITEVIWLPSINVEETANRTKNMPALFIRTMNRVQNEQRIFLAFFNGKSWAAELTRTEATLDGAWINQAQAIAPITDRSVKGIFELKEDPQGWQHICYYSSIFAKTCSWVTTGDFDVKKVYAVNRDPQDFYKIKVRYTSTEMGSTMQHLYSVDLDLSKDILSGRDILSGNSSSLIGSKPKRETPLETFYKPNVDSDPVLQALEKARSALVNLPENIKIDSFDLVNGGFYDVVSVNGVGTAFQICYKGPGTPFCGLYRTPNSFDGNQKKLELSPWVYMETNSQFKQVYSSDIEFPVHIWAQISVPSTESSGYEWLNVELILPPFFSFASSGAKYPLLLNCYGGPDSQLVTTKLKNPGFHDYMTGEGAFGGIVAIVDAHGTSSRGRAFRSIVNQKLGYYESMDQANSVKSLLAIPQLQLDESRVGLWGWSFGGYLTLKTVASAPQSLYKAAVAVAPVTDWRYYDSVYTERYMGLPQANQKAYDEAAVFANLNRDELASKFFAKNGTKVLLMHGLSDDNVHFQNTEAVLESLVNSIAHSDFGSESEQYSLSNFQLMAFPDNDHSISTQPTAPLFLYEKLREFFLSTLYN